MFIPLAPQASGKAGLTELLFSRTNMWLFVHIVHEYIDLCAQPKIAESWMTPPNFKIVPLNLSIE
jgi:hypothetical protein